jgi:hypothetical protein
MEAVQGCLAQRIGASYQYSVAHIRTDQTDCRG